MSQYTASAVAVIALVACKPSAPAPSAEASATTTTAAVSTAAAASTAAASSAAASSAATTAPSLQRGDAAPPFSLQGSDGKMHALSDDAGKDVVVVAWFPKAFTGG